MKLHAKKKFRIRNTEIGGEKYIFCISTRPNNLEQLADVREAKSLDPDIIEWRIDHHDLIKHADFDDTSAEDLIPGLLEVLHKYVEILDGTPLTLTSRNYAEGGVRVYPDEIRIELMEALLRTGLVDLVDCEMGNETWFIEKITRIARETDTKVIMSFHNFTGIPSEDAMIEKIVEGQTKGGDISKMLLIAKDSEEVMKIARAARRAKQEGRIDVPMVFYAMGDAALITRILGGRYGADMVYFSASGEAEGGVDDTVADYRALQSIFGD